MPTWWPDGRSVIFEREDLEGQTVGAPGQEVPRYPSRIEVADADGNNRWILEQTGREPSVAPDGSRVVFARTSNRGASLLSWENGSGAEQTLVPEGKFADVAYPHFSPDGNQIAFVAPESGLGATDLVTARTVDAQLLGGWLAVGPMVAEAHGIPWDPWIMNADGSALRRAAVVGGDEPSVSWSPDGSQLFVYGGTGSAVVDARTGDAIQLSFVKGYGPTTWLPTLP
jgi:Tol biopolymer transport system component